MPILKVQLPAAWLASTRDEALNAVVCAGSQPHHEQCEVLAVAGHQVRIVQVGDILVAFATAPQSTVVDGKEVLGLQPNAEMCEAMHTGAMPKLSACRY